MKFAEEHHPELGKLLRQLKKAESPEFRRAITELAGQIARIERFRERVPARFDNELAAWKVDSKIKLLIARWAMSQDPALERQIRTLLSNRLASRTAQLEQERARAQQRVTQLEGQLKELKTNPNQQVEAEFTRLTRRINATQRQRTSANRSQNDSRSTNGTKKDNGSSASQRESKKENPTNSPS